MNEYRITRRDLYQNGAHPTDITLRQGHYIQAYRVHDAIKQMEAQYPGETFDVQLWKRDSGHEPLVMGDLRPL